MNHRVSRRSLTALLLLFFLLFLPLAASAFEPGSATDPWDTGLASIYQILQGPTVRIIGFIMIVVAGILIAVTEGQAIKKLLWVIGGMGIALNVPAMFNMLFPSAGGVEIHALPIMHVHVILSLL